MRRCEDEKMFYRPPLLEEPCAQTLSGKTMEKTRKNYRPRGASPQSLQTWGLQFFVFLEILATFASAKKCEHSLISVGAQGHRDELSI